MAYNEEHNITPRTLSKTKEEILQKSSILDMRSKPKPYIESEEPNIAADPLVAYMNKSQLEKLIQQTEQKMKAAAKDLDFIQAAAHRDEMNFLKKKLKEVLS
jgi:excinuclease ABC subunit B